MAKDSRAEFVKKYRPIAEQVGKEIGVDPNVILSQWALESGWGRAVPAENNIAGIKDFTGAGTPAKDNKLGTTSNYARFESPEVFGVYYSDMMQRQFPNALNTGSDIGAFTRGLRSGRSGSYFEADPTKYAVGLTAIHNSLPGTEPAPRPTVEEPKGQEAPEETDDQREARMQADDEAFERRQAQLYGGVAGATLSGKKVLGDIVESGAARIGRGLQTGRASVPMGGLPETGGLPAPTAPGGAPATSAGPSSVVRQQIPSGGPDGGRLAPGQTGTMPYNYAKAAGLTDIEAGRALDMTKQAGGVHDLTTQRREGMQKIQQLFPGEKYVENPRFGGLLTLEQGAGGGPRQSFAVQGPVRDVPPGTLMGPAAPPPEGTLRQLPPRVPVPTVAPPPVRSGLDSVSQLFKSMMEKVGPVASTVGKYVAPPLALASAAGEGMNIAQQAGKPKGQRDLTSMGLSGLNIIGSGMSMFPPTMAVGIPLSLGTAAAQAYRQNPEFKKFVDENVMQRSESPDGGLPYAAP